MELLLVAIYILIGFIASATYAARSMYQPHVIFFKLLFVCLLWPMVLVFFVIAIVFNWLQEVL